MKTAIAVASLVIGTIVAVPVFAEEKQATAQKPTKEQTEVALEKLKADKKYRTSQEMQLTDAEAKVFWPLYDEYQAGLQKLNQRILDLLTEYAELYRNNTMTDAKANKLVADMVAIDSDEVALKRSMIPKLQKVLPGVKVARYMQIENKMRALVKIQLGDKIPLAK
jgi:GTPase Era involved in 16S rRNA processing